MATTNTTGAVSGRVVAAVMSHGVGGDVLDYDSSPWTYAPLTAEEIAYAAADLPLLIAPNAASQRNQDAEWRSSIEWTTGTDETRTDAVIRWRTTRVHDGFGDVPTQGSTDAVNALLFDLSSVTFDTIAIIGHNFAALNPTQVQVEIADDSGFTVNPQVLAEWTGDYGRRLVETRLAQDIDADGVRVSDVRWLRILYSGGATERGAICEVFLGTRYSPPHRQDDDTDEESTDSRFDVVEADSGDQQRLADWTGRLVAMLRWRPDTDDYVALFRDFFAATRWGLDPFLYIPAAATDQRVCYLARTSAEWSVVNDAAESYTVEVAIVEQAPFVSKEPVP